MQTASNFRSDINGLRAWAVIAVACYHFKLPGFSGGFTGVDIFFVISGFLMTGVINRSLDNRKFSLIEFYTARILRIIPCLLLVCICTLVLGYFVLFQKELIELSKQTSSALLFFSNIHFQKSGSYFTSDAYENLLLHTWSLSIEWQFYILLPLVIYFTYKFSQKKSAQCLSLLLLTLTATFLLQQEKQQNIDTYYSFIARSWELIIGCLIFHLTQYIKLTLKISNFCKWLGFALLALGVIYIQPENWPNQYSIIPVLGAALIIFSNTKSTILLSSTPLQHIGNWSYALYLWHWPLCVLLFLYEPNPSYPIKIATIGASLLLAALTHHTVEKFFLKKDSYRNKKLIGIFAVFCTTLAYCYWLNHTKIDDSRFSARVNNIIAGTQDKNPHMGACSHQERLSDRSTNRFPCTYFNGQPSTEPRAPDLIMLGDSHAAALVNLVSTLHGGLAVKAYITYTCPPIIGLQREDKEYRCMHLLPKVLEEITSQHPNIPVLIYSRYSLYIQGPNESTVRDNNNAKKLSIDGIKFGSEQYQTLISQRISDSLCHIAKTNPVSVIAPTPELGSNLTKQIARDAIINRQKARYGIEKSEYLERNRLALSAIQAAAATCQITIFDPIPLLCEKEYCSAIDGKGPRYFDDDHLSQHGASLLLDALAAHLLAQ